jgi:hypothetical protein
MTTEQELTWTKQCLQICIAKLSELGVIIGFPNPEQLQRNLDERMNERRTLNNPST